MSSFEKLLAEGLKDLIIDLRDNPGGYLQETVKILSQMIESKDQLLVYTEGENSKRSDYHSTGKSFFEIDDIVVLINRGSASASEILAGAMQDLDRGLVVGRRSFGKGLVQEQYPLKNGSAIRLTTGRYFTASGRLIQRPYTNVEEYADEFDRRDANGEYDSAENIPLKDSTEYSTINGRIVHGGGGVFPDVFVSAQNPFLNNQWPKVAELLDEFVVRNMNSWDKYKRENQQDFIDEVNITDSDMADLFSFIRSRFPIARLDEVERKNHLKRNLKAVIGQFLFNSSELYFSTLTKTDRDVEEALGAIQRDEIKFLLRRNTAIRE